MIAVVVLLFCLPVVLCGFNALLNRLPRTRPHSTPFAAGKLLNLLCIPLYVTLHIKVFGPAPLPLLAGALFVLIYANCLVFLNWFVFTLTDVSMHIQLAMQISRTGSLPLHELTARYNKKAILQNRVPRLLELGQLQLVAGRLFATGGSVLFGAWVCQWLRRILSIPERPEDADHS